MSAEARIVSSPAVAKPYRRPVLVKGPVLTHVTAIVTVSGVPSDGA